MSNKKYICPRCNNIMYWTGEICQNPNETRWCSALYQYKCINLNCRYESRYDELDSAGLHHKEMIDRGLFLEG